MGFDPATMAVVASAAIAGGADILGGAADKSAANAQAVQYEQNAKNAMTAADQRQAERLRDLQSTYSSIDAIRTGHGLDVASPTGMAIRDRLGGDARRAITTDRANATQEASANYNAATSARNQGQAAYLGGFLKAGSSLLGAYGKTGKK